MNNSTENKKQVYVINGSASANSANKILIDHIKELTKDDLGYTDCPELKSLPHFDPELSIDRTPEMILNVRSSIEQADAVLICTPEYIFSIPSGLKNLIEWCVSTTIFTNKPTGIITASASGVKGHEELKLIMGTVMALFSNETTLLIQGVKGKTSPKAGVTDSLTLDSLKKFIEAFKYQLCLTGN